MTEQADTPFVRLPQQDGVLVLDKPSGPTSRRCLNALKAMGQKKIGHAGTLDPMASGVLLVLLGQATKLSDYLLQGGFKIYRGTLELGRETDTWDAEGAETAKAGWNGVTEADVTDALSAWLGSSMQEVPPYSAAKHQGQPLYRLARKGLEVPQKVKRVEISRVEAISVDLPSVSFRVTCSSGTYIRSLAHSLGTRLQCGAVLTELVREYSHPFGLSEAVGFEALKTHPEILPAQVRPIGDALPGWPRIALSKAQARRMRDGWPVACPPFLLGAVQANDGLCFLTEDGSEAAIGRLDDAKEAGSRLVKVARGLWKQP